MNSEKLKIVFNINRAAFRWAIIQISLEGASLPLPPFRQKARSAPAPRQLIILMHGWGADSQDLLPLAPLLAQDDPQMVVVVPDAPDICSANPFGRQWFELASPDLASEMIAQACSDGVPTIHQMLDSLSAAIGVSAKTFSGRFFTRRDDSP